MVPQITWPHATYSFRDDNQHFELLLEAYRESVQFAEQRWAQRWAYIAAFWMVYVKHAAEIHLRADQAWIIVSSAFWSRKGHNWHTCCVKALQLEWHLFLKQELRVKDILQTVHFVLFKHICPPASHNDLRQLIATNKNSNMLYCTLVSPQIIYICCLKNHHTLPTKLPERPILLTP